MLRAEDGKIGRCRDFLFDNEIWVISYMVGDTVKWLPGTAPVNREYETKLHDFYGRPIYW